MEARLWKIFDIYIVDYELSPKINVKAQFGYAL